MYDNPVFFNAPSQVFHSLNLSKGNQNLHVELQSDVSMLSCERCPAYAELASFILHQCTGARAPCDILELTGLKLTNLKCIRMHGFQVNNFLFT